MTLLKDFAAKLDGGDYGIWATDVDIQYADENGIVIVFGASDDLMEFRGAICVEVDCYDGTTVYFDKEGKMISYSVDPTLKYITAVWDGEFPWTYDTNIPHETFDIIEDGEVYCRGMVFLAESLLEAQ